MAGETEDATGANREKRARKGRKKRQRNERQWNEEGGHRVGAESGSVNDGGQSGRKGRTISRHRHPPARQCWNPFSGRPELYYNTIN
jgi:hypothetical protein